MTAPTDRPDEAPRDVTTEHAAKAAAKRSDAANWAKGISTLKVSDVPAEAVNLNVEGRRVVSPLQGFGRLWQKTYRIGLGDAVSPTDLIREWKQHFSEFWPEGNKFYGPLTGIAPGEVALLNLKVPGRVKLSTGVLVIYADDEGFTFMTPSGHAFAGFITFSSAAEPDGTFAQIQALIRANDPFYEIGMPLMMGRMEDRFWFATLKNLAAHFGVQPEEVDLKVVCVDRRRQWKNWSNIRHNAAVRSGVYAMGAPGRWIAKPFRRTSRTDVGESKERR